MPAPTPEEMLPIRRRALQEGRRRAARGLLDDPIVRAMISLAAVIAVFVALANAPLYSKPGLVGWGVHGSTEPIVLHPLLPREEEAPSDPMFSGMKASAYIDPFQPPEEKEQSVNDEGLRQLQAAIDSIANEPGAPAAPLEIFELSGREPELAAGLSSLYLQVDYPMEARRKHIEGQVILSFTVDEEGYVHDIDIMQSVHPLLDSAAVEAVRDTRFAPGEHNGEAVSVRMRLPIRFQLIDQID